MTICAWNSRNKPQQTHDYDTEKNMILSSIIVDYLVVHAMFFANVYQSVYLSVVDICVYVLHRICRSLAHSDADSSKTGDT